VFLTYFENFEFSERNPYPGCIASAFVISAAAIISNRTSYFEVVLCKQLHQQTHMKLSTSAVE
jgi:hypothetical protein